MEFEVHIYLMFIDRTILVNWLQEFLCIAYRLAAKELLEFVWGWGNEYMLSGNIGLLMKRK